MLVRALRRRAALARRAIGVATLARWTVVEVHIRYGKKSRRVPRVCRLVVSLRTERALVQRASRRATPSGRRRGGGHV